MKTAYKDHNIRFYIEDTELQVLNLVFERFSRHMPAHSHGQDNYELHFISYGYGTLIARGETYDIGPNTLYMTGPHVVHEQIPDKDNPMAEYCIYFKIQDQKKRPDGSLIQLIRSHPFWFGTDMQDMNSTIHLIFQEFENTPVGYQTQIISLLQQCIVKLVRNYEHRRREDQTFAHANLVDQKYLIAEEYFLYEYQTLSLESLAAKLGLGERQTNRFLIKCYGMNFQQKKTEAKMAAAAALLANPELSVTNIASELGYSSLEHFVTAFKKYYKMTTKEYRQQKKT